MQKTDRERAIALAGLFQAVALVRDIAYTGQCSSADADVCLGSLFRIDAEDVEAVYGGLWGLRRGLKLLADELRTPREMELARYTVNLLALERHLAQNAPMTRRLRAGIEALAPRLAELGPGDAAIVAELAELYSGTISTLTPRIMVNGEQRHLSHPENAHRIRALLLAGLRSAVLWHQAGGRRLTLLLRRRRLLEQAQKLLGGG